MLSVVCSDAARDPYTTLLALAGEADDLSVLRTKLPPHVYATSAAAYRGLMGAHGADGRNQARCRGV